MNKSRLHIPVSFPAEALHGGANNGSIFPMPINMAASWNPALVQQVQQVIALEVRAVGAERTFSPNMNLYLDPRFGRTQEGFGEDPFLTSKIAVATVNGLQGELVNDYMDQDHVIAVAKHFAAYGGFNEGGQDGSAIDTSERTLHEIFLFPWKKVIEANVRSIMPAHNEINGVPCHANAWLLRKLLRDEWGWKTGITQSDYGDTHGLQGYGIVTSVLDAAVLSFNAGVDVDLGGICYPNLLDAVKQGKVPMSILDEAVRRILRGKFQTGLFDHPISDPAKKKILDNPAHRELTKILAHQSTVLLKNQNNALPVDKTKLKSIAVIGPNAVDINAQVGGYTNYGAKVVTVLDGIRNHLPDVEVTYDIGCSVMTNDLSNITRAADLAKTTDLAIVVVGDSDASCQESWGGREGDRTSLDLSGGQLSLIQAILDTKVPTVVVMINGRPQTFGPDNALLNRIDALLEAWRPGEEGGTAIADIIFGDVNPSGKLPATFPRSVGQIGGPSHPYFKKKRQYDDRKYTFEPLTCSTVMSTYLFLIITVGLYFLLSPNGRVTLGVSFS
jgi:beta-glucosidase